MNATLVGHAGRWIMVDVGATFAGADDDRAAEVAEAHGGVLEQIIPDFRAIGGLAGRLDGIVLTHAHEDHVGGIPAMFRFQKAWPRLARTPIHATPYTLGIVRAKVEETGEKATLRTINPRKWTRIGPFDVAPLQVTHSAPETCALVIRTKVGAIVLASDAKLDDEPVLGRRTDVQALEMMGAAGVLAFLGDSTNATHEGRSTSEGQVLRGLTEVMSGHTGRVVVSTFASNVARIAAISEAARKSGRLLAGSGRSILRNVEIAQQTRLVGPRDLRLLDPRSLANVSTSKAALVCTGTQAELGSAMRKMADDLEAGRRPRNFPLAAGDLVVHSARVIPGNEATVRAMFDTYRSRGVEVIDASTPGWTIHASGHARRSELADFYRMLKPRFAVPVHGHRELIAAHEDLALSMPGVEAAVSPSEGEILRISTLGARIVGRIGIGQLATVAVGGRNAGETKLIGWSGASDPGMVSLHQEARRHRGGQHGRPDHRRRDEARAPVAMG